MSPIICGDFEPLEEVTFRRIPTFLTHENQVIVWTFSVVIVDFWD